ncbi:MAG: hypothetical protein NTY68_03870 [Candidatus Micrarchaeota archaeon]|nr:hypothetical protein [Candidatus Micrarchaeota archaeon]
MDNTLKIIILIALAFLMLAVAVVFILFILPILLLTNAGMSSVEKCLVTPQGFTCGNANPIVSVDSSKNVNIAFKFQNGMADSIKISRVLCVKGAEPSNINLFNGKGGISSKEVVPGSSYSGNAVTCYDSTGSLAQGNPKQQFEGVILIYYKLANDLQDAPLRKAIMSISTPVTSQ